MTKDRFQEIKENKDQYIVDNITPLLARIADGDFSQVEKITEGFEKTGQVKFNFDFGTTVIRRIPNILHEHTDKK